MKQVISKTGPNNKPTKIRKQSEDDLSLAFLFNSLYGDKKWNTIVLIIKDVVFIVKSKHKPDECVSLNNSH